MQKSAQLPPISASTIQNLPCVRRRKQGKCVEINVRRLYGMRRLLILLITAVILSTPALAGELYEQFIKLHPGGDTDVNEQGVSPGARQFSYPPKPTGITEIGLERAGCYGTCPCYTVRITSDGRVRYLGERYVSRLGKHTGRIPTYSFQQVAEFIRDAGVAGFHDSYQDLNVSDQETTYTLFAIDGVQKLVSDYGNSGPTTLWAIEQLIDKLLAETKWDPPKKLRRTK